MLTLKHVDKQAFESLLSRLKLSFEDLSRNDNRSQFPSPERNLDYRVRLHGIGRRSSSSKVAICRKAAYSHQRRG